MEMLTMAFLIGLLGNLHCIGMCGPIALIIPLSTTNRLGRLVGTMIYNSGRVLSYMSIGFLFGLFGTGLRMADMLQWTSITIGLILILSVIAPAFLSRVNPFTSITSSFGQSITKRLTRQFNDGSNASLFTIGLFNGLLPCGMVMTAGLASVPFGGVIDSIIFMLFFGLGTLPVMTILPMISHKISASVRTRMQRFVPYLLFLFGLLFIVRGLNLGIPYLSPKISGDKTEIMCGEK